jgi:hypothetical protein
VVAKHADKLIADDMSKMHDKYVELLHVRKVLFARLYAMRVIIESLAKFEGKATLWANAMQACWDGDVTKYSPSKLIGAVSCIVLWRDKTVELMSKLKDECDNLWLKKQLEKYKDRPEISCCRLGNPGVQCLDGHANGE